MPISERRTAALPPGLQADRPRDRAGRARARATALPSERWFCDELGVSRATVRRAIEELAADGLVEPRGRGTVVSGAPFVEPPNTLVSLSELGRARGLAATARVLRSRDPAGHDRRGRRVRRSRPGRSCSSCGGCGCSTGCRCRSTRTACRCASSPRWTSWTSATASLYEAIEGAGHPLASAEYELEARAADAEEAGLLGLAAGAPVLFATTVTIGEDGRIVDLGATVYRADRYRFQATLTRRTPRERGSHHEEPLARRPCRPRWRSPSPGVGGRRARTRRTSRQPGTPAEQVKTDGFEDLGPVTLRVISGEGSGGPREALKEQTRRVRGEVPERHRQALLPRHRELVQAGQARGGEREPAGGVRGQPGLPGRRRAGEGRPDPAARRVRQGLRVGPVLHARDAAAVHVDRRREDLRRGHALGRRPDRPVHRRVRQHGQAAQGGRRPGRR